MMLYTKHYVQPLRFLKVTTPESFTTVQIIREATFLRVLFCGLQSGTVLTWSEQTSSKYSKT